MAKRKVQLFIGDRPVDLSDNSLILYNYQMDDLKNPAAVKNSYSQQVTLPGTANNNLLFGEIFRLDTVRLDLYGESYTGAGFIPWRRTPFVIYDETGQIIENGYMRLDQVNRAGANVSYTVSLFGGLGSFIYSLMYDDDGNKLSLADLDYLGTKDTEHELDFIINSTTVAEAWSCLGRTQVQSDLKKWNVINFAPAYNGVPSDFDASKAVMKLTDGNYIASEEQNYKTKGGYTLVTLPKEYSEWDVKDLRSYHQRPVISMKAILSAIARESNNGGYYVDLSAVTSERRFPALDKMWVTCPMLSNETFKSDSLPASKTMSGRMVTKKRLLGFSGTPADYLLSFCKMFGLYLLCDRNEKLIKVCRRNDLYEDETLDLTKRVDLSQNINIRPLAVESKWYDFALQCVGGAFADGYKSKYGAEYGGQSADTGFGFNSDRFDVMSGNIFKSAASVLENSPYNNTLLWHPIMREYTVSNQIPSVFADGGSTYILWGTDADGEERTLTKEIARPSASSSSFRYYNNKYRGYDYDGAVKLQLHDAANKGIKGENVLVYYTGKVTYDGFGLSDDTAMMAELNNGVMCWELFYGRGSRELELPVFSRYLTDGVKILHSLDFGRPDEIGVPGIVYPAGTTIYDKMWKQYFNDRYNVDSQIKVMTCKVNLRGLDVGYGLLRKFYWFENSLWVMNKISNYSITTDDFVKVELVQVRDKGAYTNGQAVGLSISLAPSEVKPVEALGDSKSADVKI